ncbi:hypothetical protein FXV91_05120 [Methanosarcina sp. DH2]|nr:hypothetical protein [Methanosarcina sp. DH2]
MNSGFFWCSINEESIHHHNAFVERVALIGELRSEITREQIWKGIN